MASSNNEPTVRTRSAFTGEGGSDGRRSGTLEMNRTIGGYGHTDVGLVRKRNEDAFYVAPELGFAAVADGMGGAPAGELASRLAVEAVVEQLSQAVHANRNRSKDELLEACKMAVKAAEEAVTQEGRDNPVNRGLGCTLTFMLFDIDRAHYAIGHIGDSRAYRVEGDSLSQLTRDHTLAQESVDEGRLPPDAVRHHPFGHILTRVVGMEGAVEADYVTGVVRDADRFFLCTDGVIRVLDEPVIADILDKSASLEAGSQRIVEEANDRGGPDNSTVVVLSVG